MTTIRSVCVYCASSDRGPPAHREMTRRFGLALARAGIRIVYGGGGIGLMGVLADAALEAGGDVLGIIPLSLKEREVGHDGVTLEVVESMHARKRRMVEEADAFVALPGGIGTLDELVEVTTWLQLGLHDLPIYLVNSEGYWDPYLALLLHMTDHGYLNAGTRDGISVVRDDAEALARLRE